MLVKSRRHYRPSEIRKFIISKGRPLVIASDMNPLPKSIEKLATAFSSRTVFPETILTRKDKRRIASSFLKVWQTNGEELPWKNQHEKDALVAGWYAWKRLRRTLEKNRQNPETIIVSK